MPSVWREDSCGPSTSHPLLTDALHKCLFCTCHVSASAQGARVPRGVKQGLSAHGSYSYWKYRRWWNSPINKHKTTAVMRSTRAGMGSSESPSQGCNPRRWRLSRGLRNKERKLIAKTQGKAFQARERSHCRKALKEHEEPKEGQCPCSGESPWDGGQNGGSRQQHR